MILIKVGTDVFLDSNSLHAVIQHLVHDELLLDVGLQVVFDEDRSTVMVNKKRLVL